MSYININNLYYKYPQCNDFTLENINIEINKGDFVLILGNSGSGKSSLAKCLTGAIPNFYGGSISGEVLVNNKSITDFQHSLRAKEITMVFQDPEKQLVMDKVHREIAFGLENTSVPEETIRRRVWEALQFLNIGELAYRDISTLSGGQKQKVAIAAAVAYTPNCIILDEPTSQLDPSAAEEIINMVKKINDELGITVVVIEQRVGKWFDLADKLIVLDRGKIVHQGTRQSMYENMESYVSSFIPPYLKLCKGLGIKEIPNGLKEARKILSKFNYNFRLQKFPTIRGDKVISLSNLTCRYENKEAIKDMTLDIFEGDFLGILGPNGAGKSTLLKSMMGLLKYSGNIKLYNQEVKKLKLKDIGKLIGYVSQNPNDYISQQTVYEELKFTLNNYRLQEESVIDETLKLLGIYHLKDINPRDASGGERQRIAIASILVLKPKILFLDEPTRGLHSQAKKELGRLLKELNEKGTTIVLITHDIEFAAQFCSKFLMIYDGHKTSEGNIKEVLGSAIHFNTAINKLLKDVNEDIFTLEQALIGDGR